mmetsp:Transcript_37221/g.99058  ORF Transcript_37221/g.99058 Transcript_37221/m.99058 type:complete len:2324 (+) Transcript_37221:2749-9720(+)
MTEPEGSVRGREPSPANTKRAARSDDSYQSTDCTIVPLLSTSSSSPHTTPTSAQPAPPAGPTSKSGRLLRKRLAQQDASGDAHGYTEIYTCGSVPDVIRAELDSMIFAFHHESEVQRKVRKIMHNADRLLRFEHIQGQGGGYRATQNIPEGTELAIYFGTIRSTDISLCGDHELHLGDLGLGVSCTLTIDGTPGRTRRPGMLQLVNHACRPQNNCTSVWMDSPSGLGMSILRSCRPILSGEQITYTYHPPRPRNPVRSRGPDMLFWREGSPARTKPGHRLVRCRCAGNFACPNGFWRQEKLSPGDIEHYFITREPVSQLSLFLSDREHESVNPISCWDDASRLIQDQEGHPRGPITVDEFTLSYESLRRLRPGNMIDQEILEAGLVVGKRFMAARPAFEETNRRALWLNTFIFQKICSTLPTDSPPTASERRRLERLTSRVCWDNIDAIFMPIYLEGCLHWVAAVTRLRPQIRICLTDSWTGTPQSQLDMVRLTLARWVDLIVRVQAGLSGPVVLEYKATSRWQGRDSNDCGLFCIANLLHQVISEGECLPEFDPNSFRLKLLKNFLTPHISFEDLQRHADPGVEVSRERDELDGTIQFDSVSPFLRSLNERISVTCGGEDSVLNFAEQILPILEMHQALPITVGEHIIRRQDLVDLKPQGMIFGDVIDAALELGRKVLLENQHLRDAASRSFWMPSSFFDVLHLHGNEAASANIVDTDWSQYDQILIPIKVPSVPHFVAGVVRLRPSLNLYLLDSWESRSRYRAGIEKRLQGWVQEVILPQAGMSGTVSILQPRITQWQSQNGNDCGIFCILHLLNQVGNQSGELPPFDPKSIRWGLICAFVQLAQDSLPPRIRRVLADQESSPAAASSSMAPAMPYTPVMEGTAETVAACTPHPHPPGKRSIQADKGPRRVRRRKPEETIRTSRARLSCEMNAQMVDPADLPDPSAGQSQTQPPFDQILEMNMDRDASPLDIPNDVNGGSRGKGAQIELCSLETEQKMMTDEGGESGRLITPFYDPECSLPPPVYRPPLGRQLCDRSSAVSPPLAGRKSISGGSSAVNAGTTGGTHIITLNVGPIGLAEALPQLVKLFDECPAMVLLQECHTPPHQMASIRRRSHALLPHYCLFASRLKGPGHAKGKIETVTLIHVNLAAQATLLNIEQEFGKMRMTIPDCLARIHFVWLTDPVSKVNLLVCNCYQYQAGAQAQQQAMLDLITMVTTRWKERADHVIMGGDWNASLQERIGYSGTECIAKADRRLQQFQTLAQMICTAPGDMTWFSYGDRRQAVLDCFFSRSKYDAASVANPTVITCQDPRLDHRAVRASLSEARIGTMPPLEALRRPVRLKMASWRDKREEWKASVDKALADLQGQITDPFEWLETGKEVALTTARNILGTTGGKLKPARPFHSSQFVALQHRLSLLQVTHREILSRQNQPTRPPSKAMRKCWDAGFYPQPASFATLSDLWNPTNATWTREWQRFLRNKMEIVKDEMLTLRNRERSVAAEQERDAAINRMFSGRELQRLLHPSPPLLHTPMVRSPVPDILTLQGELSDLSTLSSALEGNGVPTMLDTGQAQVKLTRPGCLADILTRVKDLGLEVQGIHSSNPIVNSVDERLEAWEFNLGAEAMATKQRCSQCKHKGQLLFPFKNGIKREVQTWCVSCAASTPTVVDPADYAKVPWEFKKLPRIPPTAKETLRSPITMEDLDFYLQHLPDNRAPGPDGLPYELLKHAPCLLRKAVRTCINAILADSRIPPSNWLGGLVRFLFKKGDLLDLNNYRPVCLQDAVYKILSAILTDRLYRISERYGLLDPSQEGFRRLHCTQRQVQSLHWAFEEARQRKESLFCAYLDFKNAFNSVDHEALWRWLTELNIPDVDLLRSLYNGAHYRAELPYGTTAPIQLFRGTKQGDTLSPLLFGLIFNSLLVALRESGVGHSIVSSLHTPARGFADDLAITTKTAAEMNLLLRKVSQFCSWSGMRVNLAKSVITAFDFAKNREILTDDILYENTSLVNLSSSESFAYLGIRASIRGSTRAEKKHIMDQTVELTSIAKRHKYLLSQMVPAMQMVAASRFRYSAPLVPWTDGELDRLHKIWLRVHKTAWTLPVSFPASPLSLPPASGGCPLTHPKVVMVQALATHIEKLVALPDHIRETTIRKYRKLCEECGCNNERELSECLASERLPRTCPIARLLRVCGQLGVNIRLPRCLIPNKSSRDTSWFGLKCRLIASSTESPFAGDALLVSRFLPEVVRCFRAKGISCPRQLCADHVLTPRRTRTNGAYPRVSRATPDGFGPYVGYWRTVIQQACSLLWTEALEQLTQHRTSSWYISF